MLGQPAPGHPERSEGSIKSYTDSSLRSDGTFSQHANFVPESA